MLFQIFLRIVKEECTVRKRIQGFRKADIIYCIRMSIIQEILIEVNLRNFRVEFCQVLHNFA